MIKSKIATYLGFCIRSKNITFGVDNVEKERKDVFLLIADEGLGKSSFKTMVKAKEKFSCPLAVAQSGALGELTHRELVKAVAIKDKNLAQAILTELGGDAQFKLYSGGNN